MKTAGAEAAADSDEALIARYARGESAAFENLYLRHEMRIWRYLLRNLRNPATAEELMQEVWFAVARDAPRYVPTARFTTWLFTIAHHRLIDSSRTRRRVVSLDTAGSTASELGHELIEPSAGPLACAIADDQAAALTLAVERLPADQRQVFLLQAEGGLTLEEIATVTDASIETTKSRLRYARAKLREMLKEHAC